MAEHIVDGPIDVVPGSRPLVPSGMVHGKISAQQGHTVDLVLVGNTLQVPCMAVNQESLIIYSLCHLFRGLVVCP